MNAESSFYVYNGVCVCIIYCEILAYIWRYRGDYICIKLRWKNSKFIKECYSTFLLYIHVECYIQLQLKISFINFPCDVYTHTYIHIYYMQKISAIML